MSAVVDRTLKNWRWWLVVLPITILAIPILAVDFALAMILWAAHAVANAAQDSRDEIADQWRKASMPLRRWAYKQPPEATP